MDISQFNSLTSKDQKKVGNLINKLLNKSQQQGDGQEDTSGKQNRQNRSVRRPPSTQIHKVSQQGTPSQKVIEKPSQNPQNPNNPQRAYSGVDINKPLVTPDRPNLFIEQPQQLIGKKGLQAHKDDVEIDQKLSGTNEITDRNTRQEMVNAQCNICNNTYTVSCKLVYNDGDGWRFVCDRCQKARR